MTLPTLEIQLNREFLMRQRDAYLVLVDAIERLLEISPRTVELRREAKAERYAVEIPKHDIIEAK